MHAVEREAIFQIRKPKVTRAAKKESDIVVEIVKDHYCGRGSEATGGGGRQKVTHAAKKRSDISDLEVQGHALMKQPRFIVTEKKKRIPGVSSGGVRFFIFLRFGYSTGACFYTLFPSTFAVFFCGFYAFNPQHVWQQVSQGIRCRSRTVERRSRGLCRRGRRG